LPEITGQKRRSDLDRRGLHGIYVVITEAGMVGVLV
jgi:hypothetical protein